MTFYPEGDLTWGSRCVCDGSERGVGCARALNKGILEPIKWDAFLLREIGRRTAWKVGASAGWDVEEAVGWKV